jgi:hypothetical protein
MPQIIARYVIHSYFDIPPTLPLLTPEENAEAEYEQPWSWWIKYDVLNYYDADGKEHKIQGNADQPDNFKYPSDDYPEYIADEDD